MKPRLPWIEDVWPPALALKVDRICLRFEAAWKHVIPSTPRPVLEEFLDQADATERGLLFVELLDLELAYRRQYGEQPPIAEYHRRFPRDLETVKERFATVARKKPSAQVDTSADEEPTAATDSAGADRTTRIRLTVIAGPHKGQEFTLMGHDTFLVGRSKGAHFRLPHKDKTFSRIHFLVEVNPPRCRLLDMGSRNGTAVNGKKASAAELQDGDYIQAGRTTLRVAVEEVACEPASALETTATAAPAPRAPIPLPESTAAECSLCLSTIRPTDWCSDGFSLCPSCREQIKNHSQGVAGYQIARELGRGGMGVVYLAVREADRLPVALKTIAPTAGATRTHIGRFLREAEILRQLDHPNIVAFREMGVGKGRLFFAMDHVRGIDASRLLKRQGPLAVPRAVRLVCQLSQALQYAHARQFVHRDIKPANLLIAAEGGCETAKLADFGLARVYQESPLSGLTMTGDVGGTIAFMAPEQLTNFKRSKPAADQYSAAATLYTLLTGSFTHNFPENHQRRLLAVLHDEPVAVRTRRPDIPDKLASIIHRALAKDPDERFADIRAFREQLETFVAEDRKGATAMN